MNSINRIIDLLRNIQPDLPFFIRRLPPETTVWMNGGRDAINTAIDNIIGKLEAHGMLALGENQAITLKESREILEQAVA